MKQPGVQSIDIAKAHPMFTCDNTVKIVEQNSLIGI